MITETMKDLFNKYKWYALLVGIIAVLLFMFARTSLNYSNYKKISDNNVEALTDSIEYFKGKNGELIAEKTILVGDKKTLEAANEELANKLKSMKVKNAEQALEIKGYIENPQKDTTWIMTTDTTVVYPNFTKSFDFSDKWRTLTGDVYAQNNQLGLNVTKDIVNFEYTVAVKDSKVYITSDNPYVSYSEITGITAPTYKPKWSFVLGPSITAGYDPINKNWGAMVGISATFGYNIFNVGKRLK